MAFEDYLGDYRRIFEHIRSNQGIYNRPRTAFTASFSSNPAFQIPTRFLDVPGIPGGKAPGSFHLCVTAKLPTRHGDHPCYESLFNFRVRSTRTQSINFRRPQLCMSKLGYPSLASSKSVGRGARPSV
ncbi:hypothetical protein BDR03DRAFT_955948 [Suillus americanus]|nr:hypothetical protein BDR03DRAFT_955948 [Suillus americanus]